MEQERDGYAIVPAVLDTASIGALCTALERELPADGMAVSRRAGSVYGVRNLLAVPAVRELATSARLAALIDPVLGAGAKPVRAILFDKTPDANWYVPWHQDLSIAVRERPAVVPPGWGPWSSKAGIVHVQPPSAVLESLVTIRLHLDPCPAENGALRVLPGSHRYGRLTAEDIARLRDSTPEVVCACAAGDALLMRPLILHASGEAVAQSAGHRRVVHIEYAAAALMLPPGICWHESKG